MTKPPSGQPPRAKRPRRRTKATELLVIDAYLSLLGEKANAPTASEIATRARCSRRTVFERFANLAALSLAGADRALAQAIERTAGTELQGDRDARLKSEIEGRVEMCERWRPLCHALVRDGRVSRRGAARIRRMREALARRTECTYEAELATMSRSERMQLRIALDVLAGLESWQGMREQRGLSVDEARKVWLYVMDRLIPPASPAPSSQRTPAINLTFQPQGL
jgi:AcrR family transcriptional regulator